MRDGEPGDTSVALTSPSSLKGYEQDPLLIVSTCGWPRDLEH